jgi:hypothetical protein
MEGEMIIQPRIENSGRSWFSIWFDVLTNPRKQTFQKLLKEENRRIARSFSWILVSHVGVRLALVGYMILIEGKFYPNNFQSMVTIIILSLLTIILETFLLHTLSLKFKGEGSFKEIFLEFYLPDLLSTESRGKGSFKDLFFMYAAYQAPLNILFILLYAMPAGEFVSLLISLYVVLLSVLVLKSLYEISTVKSGIIVIISSVLATIPYNILAASLLRV